MVIFTTEVAIDDVWWHLTINEVTWVTLVQPCCTQKREQFECCRCRPRSASFKLFSLLSLFTFVTFPRLLSPISTLLDFSSETSSSFLITSLLLVFTTVHDLTLWDLLLKSSLWNCKIEEGFRAFHRNVRSSFFVVAHFLTMRGVSSWDVAHSTPEILKMHKSSQFAAFNWFFSAASLSGSPVEMCSGNGKRASSFGAKLLPRAAKLKLKCCEAFLSSATQLLPCFAIAACGKCKPSLRTFSSWANFFLNFNP